jgi:replicative DNA helicase
VNLQDTADIFLTSATQSSNAERAVLGVILSNNEAIYHVADILKSPEAFQTQKNRIIYNCCLELLREQQPIDLTTLIDKLGNDGLEKVGGITYVCGLLDTNTVLANVEHYAKIVVQKYKARKLSSIVRRIDAEISEGADVEEIQSKAINRILALDSDLETNNAKHISDILPETLNTLRQKIESKSEISGISTGFSNLDNITGGLHGGELVVIAARPSMGKTGFGLNILENIAMNQIPSVMYSMEMPHQHIMNRLLSSQSNISTTKLINGRLNHDEQIKITNTASRIKKFPIFIDDLSNPTLIDIISRAHKYQALHGVNCILIDYLQLIKLPKAERRDLQIGEATSSLKALAKTLNVAVILLSQLNRGLERRDPPVPKLADLRDSGAIEQDADIVLFIYRPNYYDLQENSIGQKISNDTAEIIIAKHRNGPVGTIELSFKETTIKFTEKSPVINENAIT